MKVVGIAAKRSSWNMVRDLNEQFVWSFRPFDWLSFFDHIDGSKIEQLPWYNHIINTFTFDQWSQWVLVTSKWEANDLRFKYNVFVNNITILIDRCKETPNFKPKNILLLPFRLMLAFAFLRFSNPTTDWSQQAELLGRVHHPLLQQEPLRLREVLALADPPIQKLWRHKAMLTHAISTAWKVVPSQNMKTMLQDAIFWNSPNQNLQHRLKYHDNNCTPRCW